MSRQSPITLRLALLFLVLWGLWTLRIGAKFYGEQDSYRTWVPAAVRNYEIYDIDDIGLLIVRNGYVTDLDDLYIYSHHPPLLVWLPALITKVAGFNEVTIRYVFPAAMMIAAAAFYVLVRRLYNERMAFWAVLFFGITPFVAYFETSYGHDPLAFMSFLLFAAIFTNWIQHPNNWRFMALTGTAVLAVWSAWPAVIFVGTIGIFGMFVGRPQHRVGIIVLGVVVIISGLLMLLLYQFWWPEAIESLLDAFVWRTSSASFREGSEPFTAFQWISRNLLHTLYFGTLGLVLLGLLGIFFLQQRGTRYANAFTLTLFLAALVYFLSFRNATYIHTYYKAFLVPSIAIAGAAGVVYSRRLRLIRPLVDGLILASFIQSIYILLLLVNTTHEPSLTVVVNYINTLQDTPDRIAVTFPDASYGSEHAVEYYTMRPIDWNRTPGDLTAAQGEDVIYIFCNENQRYVAFYYGDNLPPSTRLDDTCTAYTLGDRLE